MNRLTRWIIIIVLMCAAITSYSFGSSSGLLFFIVLGLGFEIIFWRRLLSKK